MALLTRTLETRHAYGPAGQTSQPTAPQGDDTTRTKLLDAAEKIFAEFGFEGASVRMINAEAQVDSGAIHYHFGTKQNLFRAVIQRRGEVVSNDRLERLARCKEAPGAAPLVEQIIAAYCCLTSILPSARAMKGYASLA